MIVEIVRSLALAPVLLFSAPADPLPPAAEGPQFGEVTRIGSGPTTLVLVPCLGCDWRAWDEFMDRNRSRYTMYAVSWPGMGATPLPEVSGPPLELPYWSYILDAMTTLLEKEELRDVVLVGHSAAGPYVVDYAAQHPERIRAVVSVDATITNWDTFGFSREERLEWAENEFQGVLGAYDDPAAWAELNAPPSLPSPERSAFYGRMWMTPPRHHVLAYWREWLAADVGSLIGEFPKPLLALYAIRPSDEDPAKTRRERMARFDRAGAPEHVEVEFITEAGHSIWEWRPKAFDDALAAFLEDLGSTDGR